MPNRYTFIIAFVLILACPGFCLAGNHMEEVLDNAGVKGVKATQHGGFLSRNLWGRFNASKQQVNNLVKYLGIQQVDPASHSDPLAQRIKSHLKQLKKESRGRANIRAFGNYDFYLIQGRPAKLRFKNGQNYEFLLLIVDKKADRVIYYASYAFG